MMDGDGRVSVKTSGNDEEAGAHVPERLSEY